MGPAPRGDVTLEVLLSRAPTPGLSSCFDGLNGLVVLLHFSHLAHIPLLESSSCADVSYSFPDAHLSSVDCFKMPPSAVVESELGAKPAMVGRVEGGMRRETVIYRVFAENLPITT